MARLRLLQDGGRGLVSVFRHSAIPPYAEIKAVPASYHFYTRAEGTSYPPYAMVLLPAAAASSYAASSSWYNHIPSSASGWRFLKLAAIAALSGCVGGGVVAYAGLREEVIASDEDRYQDVAYSAPMKARSAPHPAPRAAPLRNPPQPGGLVRKSGTIPNKANFPVVMYMDLGADKYPLLMDVSHKVPKPLAQLLLSKGKAIEELWYKKIEKIRVRKGEVYEAMGNGWSTSCEKLKLAKDKVLNILKFCLNWLLNLIKEGIVGKVRGWIFNTLWYGSLGFLGLHVKDAGVTIYGLNMKVEDILRNHEKRITDLEVVKKREAEDPAETAKAPKGDRKIEAVAAKAPEVITDLEVVKKREAEDPAETAKAPKGERKIEAVAAKAPKTDQLEAAKAPKTD